MRDFDIEDLWKRKAGRLEEGNEEAFKILGWAGQRTPAIRLRTRAQAISRKSVPAEKLPTMSPQRARYIADSGIRSTIAPFHLAVTPIRRVVDSKILSCIARKGRVPVYPTGHHIRLVKDTGAARYHDTGRIYSMPHGHPFLQTAIGRYLQTPEARTLRNTRRNGPQAIHSSGAGAEHQRYIERAGATEEALKRELEFVDDVAISMGNIGRTLKQRLHNWDYIEKSEKRADAVLQMRIIGELPHSLSPSDRREIIRRFGMVFSEKGLGWWAAVHLPGIRDGSDPRNIHFHLVYFDRPFAPGFDPMSISNIDNSSREPIDPIFAKRKDRSARGPDWIKYLRRSFSEIVNDVLYEAALRDGAESVRLFHPGSYLSLGIVNRPRQHHLGPRGTALLRTGRLTEHAERNQGNVDANSRARENDAWDSLSSSLDLLIDVERQLQTGAIATDTLSSPSNEYLTDIENALEAVHSEIAQFEKAVKELAINRAAEFRPISDNDCRAAHTLSLTRVSPDDVVNAAPTLLQLVDRALHEAQKNSSPSDNDLNQAIRKRRDELLQGEIKCETNSDIEYESFDLDEAIRRRQIIAADFRNCVSAVEAQAALIAKLTTVCIEKFKVWKAENAAGIGVSNDNRTADEHKIISEAKNNPREFPKKRIRIAEAPDIGKAFVAIQRIINSTSWIPIPKNFGGFTPLSNSGLHYRLDDFTTINIREDKHGVIRVRLVDKPTSLLQLGNRQAQKLHPQAHSAWLYFFESQIASEIQVLPPNMVQQILREHGFRGRPALKGLFVLNDGDSQLRLREDAGAFELSGTSVRLNKLFDDLERRIADAAISAPIVECFRNAMSAAGAISGADMGLSATRFSKYLAELELQSKAQQVEQPTDTALDPVAESSGDIEGKEDALDTSVNLDIIEPPDRFTFSDAAGILASMVKEASGYFSDIGRAAFDILSASREVPTDRYSSVTADRAGPPEHQTRQQAAPQNVGQPSREEFISTYRQVQQFLTEAQAMNLEHPNATIASSVKYLADKLGEIEELARRAGLTRTELEIPRGPGKPKANGEPVSAGKKHDREH